MVKTKRAATLVEMVIITLIVAIMAAIASGAIIFFVQLFMYSPRQLNTQKIAQEFSSVIIEGNPDVRGLRYTREIIDASATQFSYTYGYPATNELSVRFRWDAASKHIFRSTSTDGGSTWSTEELIPYHINSSVTIDGKDIPSVIFIYKRSDESDWISGTHPLTSISRVVVGINLKTGAGNFANFQGSFDLVFSAEIKDF